MSPIEKLLKSIPDAAAIAAALTSKELFEAQGADPGFLGPVAEGETVVGIAPPAIRALHVLTTDKSDFARQFTKEDMKQLPIGDYDAVLQALRDVTGSIGCISQLKWMLVRQQWRDETAGKLVGLRAGWQVVATEDESAATLKALTDFFDI